MTNNLTVDFNAFNAINDRRKSYGICLLSQNQYVLIVQERGWNRSIPKFGMPKGHPEKCDSNALETAKRELMEETGINLDKFPNTFLGRLIRLTSDIFFYTTDLPFNEIPIDHPIDIKNELKSISWVQIDKFIEDCFQNKQKYNISAAYAAETLDIILI
jgi:8-oxo-dGTP pyrophosphatase MutT (NUDIX family)